MAKKMRLDTGDYFYVYFIQTPPRIRKFRVSGIYSSGIEKIDNVFVICHIRHVQKLNHWPKDYAGGIEIFPYQFNQIEEVRRKLEATLDYQYSISTIFEQSPEIFNWLEMQNINVVILIVLMLLVAAINMITTLLILILEKSFYIGLFKVMGMNQESIQKIFLIQGLYLMGKGLVYGNIIALGLIFLQSKFKLVTLQEETYYVDHVPVLLDIENILLVNAGTILVCFTFLLFPIKLIAKLSPVKILRFQS
jgi:lipoprotein-releasing system permease protein